MNRRAALLCAAFILTLLSGCGGPKSRPASPRETDRVTKLVEAYVNNIRQRAEQADLEAPPWVVEAESIRVVTVEKMGDTFKALVRFETAGITVAKYALIKKEKGQYRVVGFI